MQEKERYIGRKGVIFKIVRKWPKMLPNPLQGAQAQENDQHHYKAHKRRKQSAILAEKGEFSKFLEID